MVHATLCVPTDRILNNNDTNIKNSNDRYYRHRCCCRCRRRTATTQTKLVIDNNIILCIVNRNALW